MSTHLNAPVARATIACPHMLQVLQQVNLKLPPLQAAATEDAFEHKACKASPQTLRNLSTGETFRLTKVYLGTVTHKREVIGCVKMGYNMATREAWAFKKIRLQEKICPPSFFDATAQSLPAANHRAIAHLRSEGLLSRRGHSPMAARSLLVTDKHMYLMMPLMAGDLEALRSEPDSPEKHLALLQGMAHTYAGLAEVHARGVAHRDIKPANLFHRGTPQSVCLGDFGVAGDSRVPSVNIAAPDFMSPEQWANINHDTPNYEPQKADVWGVACSFLDLRLRYNPFAVDRRQRTQVYDAYAQWHARKETFLGQHLGVDIEPFRSTFRALPHSVRPLFRLLLHPDCLKRPDANAAAKLVAEALKKFTMNQASDAVYACAAARQVGTWNLPQAVDTGDLETLGGGDELATQHIQN